MQCGSLSLTDISACLCVWCVWCIVVDVCLMCVWRMFDVCWDVWCVWCTFEVCLMCLMYLMCVWYLFDVCLRHLMCLMYLMCVWYLFDVCLRHLTILWIPPLFTGFRKFSILIKINFLMIPSTYRQFSVICRINGTQMARENSGVKRLNDHRKIFGLRWGGSIPRSLSRTSTPRSIIFQNPRSGNSW